MKTYYSTWERNFIAMEVSRSCSNGRRLGEKFSTETRFREMDTPIMQKYVKVSLMRLKLHVLI